MPKCKSLYMLVVLLFLLIIPGCYYSGTKEDELEKKHAFYVDSVHEDIEYNGIKYSKISVESTFNDYMVRENIGFIGGTGLQIFITDKGEKLPRRAFEYKGLTGQCYESIGIIKTAQDYFVTDERQDAFLNVIQTVEATEFAVQYNSASQGICESLLDSEQAEVLKLLLESDDYVMTEGEVKEYGSADPVKTISESLGIFLTDKDMFLCKSIAQITFPEGKESDTARIYVHESDTSRIIPEEYIGLFLSLIE